MSAPQITTTFTPWSLTDNQSVIVERSEAFVENLNPWSGEANTLGSWMNDQTNTIVGVGTNFVGEWSDQTGAASMPYSVSNNGVVWTLLTNLADVTASEPTSANSNWLQTTADSSLITIETGVSASIFIGQFSGQSDDGANQNVGLGYISLNSNTSGSNNTATGYASLSQNTTGIRGSAFGNSALTSNTTGGSNSAFGFAALQLNTTAGGNSAFGANSLDANTTGGSNSAFGFSSLTDNTTGSSNSAFGVSSLENNITGIDNSGFGTGSLASVTSGSTNASLGKNSGLGVTTGSRNAILGANTTLDAASSDCIIIGEGITETGSNKLNIGDVITGDLSTGNVAFNGNIGLGGAPSFSYISDGIDVLSSGNAGIRYQSTGGSGKALEQYCNGSDLITRPVNTGMSWFMANTSGSTKFLMDLDTGDTEFKGNVGIGTSPRGGTPTGSGNAANCSLNVAMDSANSRSINTPGTINASGADYAEYVKKSETCDNVSAGDVIGLDVDGHVTDSFSDAFQFGVKSTNPNLVGGDAWAVTPRPELIEPDVIEYTGVGSPEPIIDGEGNDIQDYSQYEADQNAHTQAIADEKARVDALNEANYNEWFEIHEQERATVDRIAFCGVVPVNTDINCKAGDYLIAVDNGQDVISLVAKTKSNMTFNDLADSIGRVKSIGEDGRPLIIVKVG